MVLLNTDGLLLDNFIVVEGFQERPTVSDRSKSTTRAVKNRLETDALNPKASIQIALIEMVSY